MKYTIEQIEYRQRLWIVYNKAKSKAKQSDVDGKDKLLNRLNKALSILMHKEYYVADKKDYQPTKYSCGCNDWLFRLSTKRGWTGQCGHMIAEILMDRMKEIQYQQLELFKM